MVAIKSCSGKSHQNGYSSNINGLLLDIVDFKFAFLISCEKPMKIEEFKYICAPACRAVEPSCHSDTCLKMLCNVCMMLLVFAKDYLCRKKGIISPSFYK